MRTRIFAIITLLTSATAGLLAYRASAVRRDPIVTNTEALADGHVHFTVTNNYSSAVTAIAAAGSRTLLTKPVTDRSVRFLDSVLNPLGPREIAPGKTYTFKFFGPNPPLSQIERNVQLKAVIFADGSTWRDPEWVHVLLLRRFSLYRYNNEALQRVQAARAGGATLEDLVQQLTQLRKDEFANAKTTAEKQMVEAAFDETLFLLNDVAHRDDDRPSFEKSLEVAANRLLLRNNKLAASKPATDN